ncbi:hypothetical protein EDC01DRAFT_359880 [Geopyxis carbonaria]|nr:hypothetical protein EDC01DRAFT_359880 [Geopyxis carbonaria]
MLYCTVLYSTHSPTPPLYFAALHHDTLLHCNILRCTTIHGIHARHARLLGLVMHLRDPRRRGEALPRVQRAHFQGTVYAFFLTAAVEAAVMVVVVVLLVVMVKRTAMHLYYITQVPAPTNPGSAQRRNGGTTASGAPQPTHINHCIPAHLHSPIDVMAARREPSSSRLSPPDAPEIHIHAHTSTHIAQHSAQTDGGYSAGMPGWMDHARRRRGGGWRNAAGGGAGQDGTDTYSRAPFPGFTHDRRLTRPHLALAPRTSHLETFGR